LLPTSAVYAVAGVHSFNSSGYPKDTEKYQHLQRRSPHSLPRFFIGGAKRNKPACRRHAGRRTARQPTEESSALPAETAVQAGKLIEYYRM